MGVGLGTNTDSGVEDVTTASKDVINMIDDVTMSDLIFIVDLGSVLINNHAKVSNICYGPRRGTYISCYISPGLK